LRLAVHSPLCDSAIAPSWFFATGYSVGMSYFRP